MIIKYKTSQWSQIAIERMEFERETDKMLFLPNGRRVAKDGGYYDSWKEAKAALIKYGENGVRSAESTLARKRNTLKQFQALIEPPTATKE